jgi:hypothetical protein
MNGQIERVSQYGDFVVYRRLWKQPGLLKYAVYQESDGYFLRSFRLPISADKFARWKNAESKVG